MATSSPASPRRSCSTVFVTSVVALGAITLAVATEKSLVKPRLASIRLGFSPRSKSFSVSFALDSGVFCSTLNCFVCTNCSVVCSSFSCALKRGVAFTSLMISIFLSSSLILSLISLVSSLTFNSLRASGLSCTVALLIFVVFTLTSGISSSSTFETSFIDVTCFTSLRSFTSSCFSATAGLRSDLISLGALLGVSFALSCSIALISIAAGFRIVLTALTSSSVILDTSISNALAI